MKFLGFLLLLAGWGIALTAVGLLSGKAGLAVFVLAGIGVEVMGIVFVGQSHLIARDTEE